MRSPGPGTLLVRLARSPLAALLEGQLARIVLAGIAVLVLGAVAVGLVEASFGESQDVGNAVDFASLGNSLWWSIVTVLTVGYGDMAPKTGLGRVLASIVMLAGVVMTSLFTASIASTLTERRLKEARGLQQIKDRDHVVICGANAHLVPILDGFLRAGSLANGWSDITLVNDLPDEEVQQLLINYEALRPKYVKGDFTQEAVLRRANAQQARAAIVLASTDRAERAPDERTLIATLAIKHVRPEVHVCAEILDEANAGHLRIAQADEVIVSGEHTGFLLQSAATAPGIPQAVRSLMSPRSSSPLMRVAIPSEFVGRTFEELARHFRLEEGSILIGLITEEAAIPVSQLLSGGSPIDAFIAQKFHEAGRDLLAEGKQRAEILMNPPDDHQVRGDDAAVVIGRAFPSPATA